MAKRKNQEKFEKLRSLMILSKFWPITKDVDDTIEFHQSKLEEKFEKGFTPSQIMSKWPNW